MPNHASITLIGHLGKDPEQRFTQDNKPITSLSLGVSTGYKDRKQTTWWNVTFFGKTAEVAVDMTKKGHAVMVEGEPFLEEYTDKEGNKRTSLKVNGARLVLLESRKDEPATPKTAPAPAAVPFDDDIPF
jgi:single-strand DNA-binding protein